MIFPPSFFLRIILVPPQMLKYFKLKRASSFLFSKILFYLNKAAKKKNIMERKEIFTYYIFLITLKLPLGNHTKKKIINKQENVFNNTKLTSLKEIIPLFLPIFIK